jgi:hypothetical protein
MKVIGSRFTPAPSDIIVIDAGKLGERSVQGKLTLPPKRITDPTFQYRRACDTDLNETFRKAKEARS